jgi:hypothetical protein
MGARGVLRPGWLRADVERANDRLKEWSEKAVPTRERGRSERQEKSDDEAAPVKPDIPK